jgi:thymidylate synthase (FAD)
MPTPVEIGVFCIGRTGVDRDEVTRWMKFIGADQFVLPEEGAISNPALLIALAAKRCYKSFQPGLNPNVSKIRSDYAEYFDNILKSGHGSVLEHSVYNFAIENVSRVFTGEMNRHRAGWAISEGSMRFIRYSESIPYWTPTSIRGDAVFSEETDPMREDTLLHYVVTLLDAAAKIDSELAKEEIRKELNKIFDDVPNGQRLATMKHLSRGVFSSSFEEQENHYRVLETIWENELAPDSKFKGKKEITSMMRRIVGMGVATGGVWSGNIRGLRHVITMRTSPAAEEEILHVFSRVAKLIKDREPMMFGDFEQTEEGFWVPKYVKV